MHTGTVIPVIQKAAATRETARAAADKDRSPMTTAKLEPTLPAVNVGSHKLFIGLSEVHDPLDYSDHVHDRRQGKATQHGNQQHDQTFLLVTENELVDSQTTDDDAQNSGDDFLVGARRFPVLHHRLAVHRRWRLNRLVTWLIRLLIICLRLILLAANRRQHGLTLKTTLRKVVILRAALSTKNRHDRLVFLVSKELLRAFWIAKRQPKRHATLTEARK